MTIPPLQSNCGVYAIICSITGKRYVGSSRNLKSRLRKHLYDLRGQKHKNDHLQSAWNLYGASSFSIEILEYCEEDYVLDCEQTYLDKLQAYDKTKGFNKSRTAINGGRVGSISSREHLRLTLRAQRTQRIQSCIAGQGREYRLKSPTGQIFEGKGVNEFARQHGLYQGAVLLVLDGIKKTVKGWTLPETTSPYRFTDRLGHLHEVPLRGLNEFCKQHKLGYKAMRHVAAHKLTHHQGWCHADRTDLYRTLISPSGEEIRMCVWYSQIFADANGFCREGVRGLLQGRRAQYRNWKLKSTL